MTSSSSVPRSSRSPRSSGESTSLAKGRSAKNAVDSAQVSSAAAVKRVSPIRSRGSARPSKNVRYMT